MKKLWIYISAVALLAGCGTITHTIYGPDLTPDQLRNEIYEDAYAVAQIRVSVTVSRMATEMKKNGATEQEIADAKKKFIGEVKERIALVKNSTDPMSLLNQYWYRELAEGDPDRTAIMALAGMAGRRVLKRIGISISGSNLDQQFAAIDFDRDLFLWAVGAYEKSVDDFSASY